MFEKSGTQTAWWDLVNGVWWSLPQFVLLIAPLNFLITGIPLMVGWLMGFHAGMRTGRISIFSKPILYLLVFFIISHILIIILLPIVGIIVVSVAFPWQILAFLIFSLITSTFYFFKKEVLFTKILVIFAVIFIVTSFVGGVLLAEELSSRREEFEAKALSLKESAIQSKNPDLCETIKDEMEIAKPREDYGVVYWGVDIVEYYYACVDRVAIKLMDTSLCERIGKDGYWCQKAIKALTLNDVYACENSCICVTKFAEEKGDASFCNRCNQVDRKDCFSGVALAKEDINICEMMLNPELAGNVRTDWYNRCITDLAVKQNDESLCNNVKKLFAPYDEELILFDTDDCIDEVRSKVK